MHIQGREYRFDGLNITVAYFADEPEVDFDARAHGWLGDDCPLEDTFISFEDFTLREGGGVLIVAASDLTATDMKLVNELVSASRDDHIKLLICGEGQCYQAPQFDTVITSRYDLVNSIHDLAFAFLTGSRVDEGARNISDIYSATRQNRNGVLVSYWDDRKNKNLITPYDLVEEWPILIEEAAKIVGMYTWLNPVKCIWSVKTCGRFKKFADDELICKHTYISNCAGYVPEYSRNPRPDVIQLIML